MNCCASWFYIHIFSGVGEVLWTPRQNKYAWTQLVGKTAEIGSDEVSLYAAPARAKSLEGLPPTWICVGEYVFFSYFRELILMCYRICLGKRM